MARTVAVLCPECGCINALLRPVDPLEVVRFLICPVCECQQHVDLKDPAKVISNERPGSRQR